MISVCVPGLVAKGTEEERPEDAPEREASVLPGYGQYRLVVMAPLHTLYSA